MITVHLNGDPFDHFISVKAEVILNEMANRFEFKASADGDYPAPKEGDEITIYVDGVKKVTGKVEDINGSEEEGSHSVTYYGRDKTSDFVDSTINVIDEIKASETMTLKKILLIIINHLGANIKVIDNVEPEPFNSAEDIITPRVGDKAIDLALAFARKRQCLLTSNADGDIVIERSKPTDSGATLKNKLNSNDNNVFGQSWKTSTIKKFNKYIHRGQVNPSALNFAGDTSSETAANQYGEAVDETVAAGRQNVVVESKSYTAEQLKNRALWSMQLARAEATWYKCSIKGHSKGEAPWDVNELAMVISAAANIERNMLIKSVLFSQGEGEATASSLHLVEQDVYTIEQQIASQQPAGSLMDAFKQ